MQAGTGYELVTRTGDGSSVWRVTAPPSPALVTLHSGFGEPRPPEGDRVDFPLVSSSGVGYFEIRSREPGLLRLTFEAESPDGSPRVLRVADADGEVPFTIGERDPDLGARRRSERIVPPSREDGSGRDIGGRCDRRHGSSCRTGVRDCAATGGADLTRHRVLTSPGARPMRVMIFNWKDLAHPAAGGAEVFTEQVARVLVERGHAVTLFASSVTGRPARELVDGVDVVRAGGRFTVYRAARRFWRSLPAGSFDVVVDEINTRPFLAPKWVDDVPVVALIHQLAREIWSYETPFPVSLLGRYVLEPWWLRAYRRVPALTVSRSSAESLARYHRWENVTVVPEGLDPHPVPDVPKETEPTLVYLGRLVAMKRPRDALRVLTLVRRVLPEARLWMIGDGPLLARLQGEAPHGVTFFGHVGRDRLVELLSRAHVLVTTSVREGWGLNVSEAAACGTPAIGYRVPGLVDSIPASGGALVDEDVRGARGRSRRPPPGSPRPRAQGLDSPVAARSPTQSSTDCWRSPGEQLRSSDDRTGALGLA